MAEEEGLKGLLKRRARLKTFSPGPWYGYPRCRGRDARVCLLVGGRGIDVKKKKGEEVEGEKDNLLFYFILTILFILSKLHLIGLLSMTRPTNHMSD